MRLAQLETPALILDMDAFLRNLERMQVFLQGSGASLRPHYKCHKCPDIVRFQLEHGARGITCAKLGEAEDAADAGIEDILIANQVVQPSKLPRLAELAKKCRLTVCVDCAENIAQLAAAACAARARVYCYVEFDTGMRRCGVTDFAAVETLIRRIGESPFLTYAGIQAYAGHLSHMEDAALRQAASDTVDDTLKALRQYLSDRGIAPGEISGVSTGTALCKKPGDIYTEFQCGSYAFMDAAYNHMDLPFENALFVLGSVVSCREDWIVTDAGIKTLGVDQGPPVALGFAAAEVGMSEEHCTLYMRESGLRLNDKVKFIPGHCCTTMNVYDKLYVYSGDRVIGRFQITGRGRSA